MRGRRSDDDPAINALRASQIRNMLATLLLSQGTPMLLAGDEFARTQQGNNNAYCQDNDISWVDWAVRETGDLLVCSTETVGITARVSNLRRIIPDR